MAVRYIALCIEQLVVVKKVFVLFWKQTFLVFFVLECLKIDLHLYVSRVKC